MAAELPQNVEKIGVFVSESAERIAEVAQQAALTGVQLQGGQGGEFVGRLRASLPAEVRIICALRLSAAAGMAHENALAGADLVLLDSGSEAQPGGTGKTFSWQAAEPLVQRLRAQIPVIIAGGLHPGNVAEAVRRFQPFGVDVVSGVEAAPGKKDAAKVRAFIQAARGVAAAS